MKPLSATKEKKTIIYFLLPIQLFFTDINATRVYDVTSCFVDTKLKRTSAQKICLLIQITSCSQAAFFPSKTFDI